MTDEELSAIRERWGGLSYGVNWGALSPEQAKQLSEDWKALLAEVERLSGSEVCRFIDALTVADVTTRQHMIDVLRACVCIHCGVPDPDCQCWNDE